MDAAPDWITARNEARDAVAVSYLRRDLELAHRRLKMKDAMIRLLRDKLANKVSMVTRWSGKRKRK